MRWTLLTVVMLFTASVVVLGKAETSSNGQEFGGGSEFLDHFKENVAQLQACAIPSVKMFIRSVKDGQTQSSEFDRFCYYQARDNPESLYLCVYYKSIVQSYYGDHCKDPDKRPMDGSAQYLSLVQAPSATCKILVETVTYQTVSGNIPLFSSAESCENICHQSLFCTNLAFLVCRMQSVDDHYPSWFDEKEPVKGEPESFVSSEWRDPDEVLEELEDEKWLGADWKNSYRRTTEAMKFYLPPRRLIYTEKEESGGHFLVFLVVSLILIFVLYIFYHNKRKIKEYVGEVQAERKVKSKTQKVNYNVYIRLEQQS